jgi:hypothetical protein
MRRPSLLHSASLAALLAAGAGACSEASSDPGLGALFRMSGTGVQYVPGALGTDPAADTPTVLLPNVSTSIVFPGASDRPLSGAAMGSTAVLIGLDGDAGHWIAPTGLRDTDVEGAFDYQARFSISPLMPLDPPERTLILRAVDAQGQIGPARLFTLKVQALANPAGISLDGQPLVITLEWDTEADLDLKVRMPNTANPDVPIDVWTRHPIALPVLGPADPPYDPTFVQGFGMLDYDSNANCVLDGLLRENVVFQEAPPSPKAAPSGTYEVRVDATSLCGQVTARWHAYAVANGTEVLSEAYGQAIDIDTQGSHGPATGTLAFTFMMP